LVGKTPEVQIYACHPQYLERVWPVIEPWLARALTFGPDLWTTEFIGQQLQNKERILWLATTETEILGFCITTLTTFPKGMVLEINWTGGATHKGRYWMHQMFDVLKAWGLHCGANKLGGGGRRGWLEMFGFKEHGVMFVLEI